MNFEDLRAILYNVCVQAKSNESTPHDVVNNASLGYADRSYGFGRLTDAYASDLSSALKLAEGEIITTRNYGMIVNYVLQLGAEVVPLNSTVPKAGEAMDEVYLTPGAIKTKLDDVYTKLRSMESLSCRTQCLGSCKSSCLNTCLSDCATNCTKTCGASCTGNCKATCKDGCQNTCKNHCQTGCNTSCLASCKGLCYNTCSGGCYTGCSGCRGGH